MWTSSGEPVEPFKVVASAIKYVCVHCKYFPMRASFVVVTIGHSGRKKGEPKFLGWWSANYEALHEWRRDARIVMMQTSDSEDKLHIFWVHGVFAKESGQYDSDIEDRHQSPRHCW